MRLARVRTPSGPRAAVLRDGQWRGIESLFAPTIRETGATWPVDEVSLAAPCEPRVLVGMSHNGSPEDRHRPPQAFLKSARTVCGPGAPILVESGIGEVAIEGELALVIGSRARHLSTRNALDAVLGITIANDVTAVDQVSHDSLFTQAKNGDGFTPIGPWIETVFDASNLEIVVELDGRLAASGSTSSLAWNPIEQLVYLSSIMELGPGDVILTGAPGTTVPVVPGQAGGIRIDGLGSLDNPIMAGASRASLPAPHRMNSQEA
ncbi:MAG: fumarylacetoacetate hydrolase family protein [Actinomycetota bacterium]|nr:fumarylacetoacetate hydrolase family protein [Actinomycetota bacterium]